MPRTNRKRSWWDRQNVIIKSTIIAGAFSLMVASCTIMGQIMPAVVANFPLNKQTSNDQISSSIQYPLTINAAASYMETPILFAGIDDKIYGIASTSCVVADYGTDFTEQFDELTTKGDAQGKYFAFDLVTDRTFALTDVVVQVKSFTPPPSEERVQVVKFFDPGGMGGVPIIEFPEKTINSLTESLIINRQEGSLRLDPGDAVTLQIPLIFSDPGSYDLIFVAEGQLAMGQKAEFVSGIESYSWMYITDITRFPIESSSKFADMKWAGNC